MEMNGRKFGLRSDLPRAGEDTLEVLREAGYSETEIESLLLAGLVRSKD